MKNDNIMNGLWNYGLTLVMVCCVIGFGIALNIHNDLAIVGWVIGLLMTLLCYKIKVKE